MTPSGRPPKDETPRDVRKELRITQADADLITASRRPGESETDTMLRLMRGSARAQAREAYVAAKKQLAKPGACERCGKVGKLLGHHADYSKPLEVQWLCHVCHGIVGKEDGSHHNGRPGNLLPGNCPWAAMVARKLISYSLASQYRAGAKVPGRLQLEVMHLRGYEVDVTTGPDGKRRAVCPRWPEMEVDDGR